MGIDSFRDVVYRVSNDQLQAQIIYLVPISKRDERMAKKIQTFGFFSISKLK